MKPLVQCEYDDSDTESDRSQLTELFVVFCSNTVGFGHLFTINSCSFLFVFNSNSTCFSN